MKDCTLGVEVRRTWTEKEMVRSIDGRLFPGTPDGMFEDWNGALTCVQVVRVPLVSEPIESMKDTLAMTILSKVVKSQHWLRASPFKPNEFIIFCWLPFAVPEVVAEYGDHLMSQVQQLDSRFSLRLRLPGNPESLFPALFASNKRQSMSKYNWSDVATYPSSEEEESDEECYAWDITWSWSEDSVEVQTEYVEEAPGASAEEEEEEDFDCDWDITWDYACSQEGITTDLTTKDSDMILRIVLGLFAWALACGICIKSMLVDNG